MPPAHGLEVQLLYTTLQRYLDWPAQPAFLRHRCVETTEQLLALVGAGKCDLAPGVVALPAAAAAPNVALSLGAYRFGLRALVRVATRTGSSSGSISGGGGSGGGGGGGGGSRWSSLWRFTAALSLEVWVALILTSVGVGALIWVAEVATQNARAEPAALQALAWDALGRATQTRDLVTFSSAGSLLALAFSLLAVIVMSL